MSRILRASAVEERARAVLDRGAAEGERAVIIRRYRHGLDVRVGTGGETLYLSTAARGLYPLHVVLDARTCRTLLDMPVGAGIGLREDSGGVVLLARRRVFSLERALAGIVCRLDEEALADRGRRLGEWLAFLDAGGGLQAGGGVEVWRSAFADAPQAQACMRDLIGRGSGSTPAGDDMLVGAAAVATVLMKSDAELGRRAERWLKRLERCAPEFEKKTTAMSCAYLRAALEGRFAGHLLGFVSALLSQERRPAGVHFEKVLRHGATSGADALQGCRLFLEESDRVVFKGKNV